ncbi:MAG: YceD family protein [Succinivibrio sp.]
MADLAFAPVVSFDKAVSLEQRYDTLIDPSFLERLSEACVSVDEPARAKFGFFRDLQGLRTIEGEISCSVTMRCQRCGGNIKVALHSKFRSTCDEAKAKSLRIDDHLDIVPVTAAGDFELLSYLEDCLLLEVPYSPRHEEGDEECQSEGMSFGEIPDEEEANPFAALGGLREELRRKSGA